MSRSFTGNGKLARREAHRIGRDEAELDKFVVRRANLIYGVLSCGLDPDGVRLESE